MTMVIVEPSDGVSNTLNEAGNKKNIAVLLTPSEGSTITIVVSSYVAPSETPNPSETPSVDPSETPVVPPPALRSRGPQG